MWDDDCMSSEMIIGLVVGAGLILAGALLGVLCVWSRGGGSAAARWWVAKAPLPQQHTRPSLEGPALVLLPVLAETLVVLGGASVLGPVLAPVSGLTLVLVLVVAIFQLALYVTAHSMTWQRWILPLWVYPSWLRETRRHEKTQLPDGRR